jgi:hypothetical protein
MEGLIKRTWIIAGVVLACGAFTMYVPPARSKPIDETWMAQHAPDTVGAFHFEGDPSAPAGQSYKMSKSTYDTLQPSGILARYYVSGDKTFDVVLISSDNSVSFHDPRVCFTASGWNIINEQHTQLQTQAHGKVPITMVQMEGDGEKKSALYFYRGPSGYESVARKMRWDMLVGELVHGRNDQGVFYRFIPMTNNISQEETQQFAAKYLDEANRVSGGFF